MYWQAAIGFFFVEAQQSIRGFSQRASICSYNENISFDGTVNSNKNSWIATNKDILVLLNTHIANKKSSEKNEQEKKTLLQKRKCNW